MHETDAIILNTRKSGEADELINIYTKDFGKLLLKVRAAKKITTKQGNFLHTPSIVRCGFVTTRGGYVLSGIKSVREYREISGNIFALGFVISFFRICDSILRDGQRDEKLWNLLTRVLEEASGAAKRRDPGKILWRMEKAWLLTLLAVMGLKPDKLKLNSISSASRLDIYIKKMLQDKFERPVNFFGLQRYPEYKK
ncbi:MAG: DNA repair protein RecO [Candidatus Spechtbacterales bacterium]